MEKFPWKVSNWSAKKSISGSFLVQKWTISGVFRSIFGYFGRKPVQNWPISGLFSDDFCKSRKFSEKFVLKLDVLLWFLNDSRGCSEAIRGYSIWLCQKPHHPNQIITLSLSIFPWMAAEWILYRGCCDSE